MNSTERRMIDILKRGRDQYGVVAVKAEFEAEGTRPDEFLKLLEMARRADVKVALKIGGCEAMSDLMASKNYGVDYIIAPMVETPYALTKFIEAFGKTHTADERAHTDFLFNLETETTLKNLGQMLPIAKAGVDGIVFGRVDFTLSNGLSRSQVNDARITRSVLQVAEVCAREDMELVVGGSVSLDAIDALRDIRAVRLDRFETRKVIFDGAIAERGAIGAAITNAVDFEVNWLRNKQSYYSAIAAEDASRIAMIEARIATAAQAAA